MKCKIKVKSLIIYLFYIIISIPITVKHSMGRYRNIETTSGIAFFEEAGFLRIGQQDDPRVNDINDLANTLKNDGVDIKTVDDQYLKDKFPFLRLTY